MVILYEGPSMLDGAPIVVIATGIDSGSSNAKTGAMVQTWILRKDRNPVEASRLGLDSSNCGACPHMGRANPDKESGWADNRGCYVNLGQAPLNVWKTYMAGKYRHASPDEFAGMVAGRALRLGAYGDPGAAPAWVFIPACESAGFVTAYSHQWRNPAAAWLKAWAMASVDTVAEASEASAAGWRYFRVRPLDSDTLPGEVICPASKEAGNKTICAACKACGGMSSKARASIVIMDHGPQKLRRVAFRRVKAAA